MANNFYGLKFHGSFRRKSDAKAKQEMRPGSFIVSKFIGKTADSLRYIVCTKGGATPKKRKAKKRPAGAKRRRGSATDFNFGWGA